MTGSGQPEPASVRLWEAEGQDLPEYPTLRQEREGWGTRLLVTGIEADKLVFCRPFR
jgi:hypothetical protein